MANIKQIIAQYQETAATSSNENRYERGNYNIDVLGVNTEASEFINELDQCVDAKYKIVFKHQQLGSAEINGTFYAKNCPNLQALLLSASYNVTGKVARLKVPFKHKVELRVLKPEFAKVAKYTPRVLVYSEGDNATVEKTGAELFGKPDIVSGPRKVFVGKKQTTTATSTPLVNLEKLAALMAAKGV